MNMDTTIGSKKRQLLSELLRPQEIGDLTLPASDIERLSRMVTSRSIINMLFYGKPGIGKTSAARAIVSLIDRDFAEINGSKEPRNGFVHDIEDFASTMSFSGGQKIYFIDDADQLSKSFQSALRYLIERSSRNCRFLLAVNDIKKIIPTIQSAMLKIGFDIPKTDVAEVKGRLISRYQRALPELGLCCDEVRLHEIIDMHFPDLRAIANRLERLASRKRIMSVEVWRDSYKLLEMNYI
jgi:DNA polymerase III delta prime subunit